MEIKNLCKVKSNSEIESDHIIMVDSNGKQLECFWFGHDVILSPKDSNNFVFKKESELYPFLSSFAKQIKEVNKMAGGNFVQGNIFTWHHMSRSWDRPFEDNAGFVATRNKDNIVINFFPAKYKSFGDNYISVGGPDGYVQPYQSISDLFALHLNEILNGSDYNSENINELVM